MSNEPSSCWLQQYLVPAVEYKEIMDGEIIRLFFSYFLIFYFPFYRTLIIDKKKR